MIENSKKNVLQFITAATMVADKQELNLYWKGSFLICKFITACCLIQTLRLIILFIQPLFMGTLFMGSGKFYERKSCIN